MSSTSLFNTTDNTYHIQSFDEVTLRLGLAKIAVANLWLGIQMTLAIALILLSTAQQRKGIVFILQCTSFALAISYNAMIQLRGFWQHSAVFVMPGEIYDYKRDNRVQMTCLSLEHWTPLLADIPLIFKLLSFYPSTLYSTRSRFIRLAPPTLLLLPRLILVSYLTQISHQIYTSTIQSPGRARQGLNQELLNKFGLIAILNYSIQAAFCLYASCALLYKTSKFHKNLTQHVGARAVRKRLRFFVEATFMTFLPPFGLSIACNFILTGPTPEVTDFRITAACLVNTSVIFSLLATSWSTIRSRGMEDTTKPTMPKLALITQLYQSTADELSSRDLPLVHHYLSQPEDTTKKPNAEEYVDEDSDQATRRDLGR